MCICVCVCMCEYLRVCVHACKHVCCVRNAILCSIHYFCDLIMHFVDHIQRYVPIMCSLCAH